MEYTEKEYWRIKFAADDRKFNGVIAHYYLLCRYDFPARVALKQARVLAAR